MSCEDQASWNDRYRSGDHSASEHDPFLENLEDYPDLLPHGRRDRRAPRALDIACGAGRNAIWLACRGWRVTGCDISIEALRLARGRAQESGVSLDLFAVDLESFTPPRERFDLVLCFFYLQRDLFPALEAALRPGGFLLYRTYTVDQLRFPGRPRHPQHLLQHQELLKAFGDLRILHYKEFVDGRGVAELLARKPLPGESPAAA